MACSLSITTTYPPASLEATNVSSHVRLMAAGKCTAKVKVGILEVECPCAKGLFSLYYQKDLGDKCNQCHHPITDHEDVGLDESLGPLTSNNIQRKVAENEATCPREDTVDRLIKLINSHPVIHIRGTPASGKTTLSQLLHDRLTEQGKLAFLLTGWNPLENFKTSSTRTDAWSALHNMLTKEFPGHSVSDYLGKSVLLVDEAQMSYGDMLFWNGIIKEHSDGITQFGIRICLFCSYGSPRTGVEDVHFTPHSFFPAQRVTITPQPDGQSPQIGLFYTESEFNDALSRMVQHAFIETITLDDEAKRYLFMLTNGHPGGLQSVMAYIYHVYRSNMKHEKTFVVTEQHIVDIIEHDEDSTFNYLETRAVARSFTPEGCLTPEVADVLSDIAENGSIPWDGRPGLQTCYRNGWIHRMPMSKAYGNTSDVCVLPSRLHEKWVEHIIGNRKNPLPTHFANLNQLCMEILRGFSAMNLRHSTEGKKLSSAAKPRPVEAQYQDEFYRVFNKLAGRGVPICSEWSRTSAGGVDFWIPEKKWAIELLKDYDRMDDHILRFKKGGRYYQWLQEREILDWIVINCATTLPTRGHTEPNLIHAIYQNDYTELQIFNHEGNPLGPVTRVTN